MVKRYVWDEEGYPPDGMELVAASDYDALAAELERVRALSIWGTSVPVGPTYDRIRELERLLTAVKDDACGGNLDGDLRNEIDDAMGWSQSDRGDKP